MGKRDKKFQGATVPLAFPINPSHLETIYTTSVVYSCPFVVPV
jgi:hypothetical protein